MALTTNDDIIFDFSKAQRLRIAIDECGRSLNDSVNNLEREINNMGSRWQGESYGAYKEGFTKAGGGKSTLVGIAAGMSSLSAHLNMVAQTKKNWEQNGKTTFGG